jgi:FkbM family methyltransferase
MNWRYFVGDTVNKGINAVLSAPIVPLTRYVPAGHFWLYDVQRFARTRDLNVIFDVGANIGQTACDLVRYLPKANIFCVEPVSVSMQTLKAKYASYNNIHFAQLAFGSRRETRTIPLHHDSELNTLVRDQPRIADLTGQNERILVETVDNFCQQQKIEFIDLLKMDVQGWELEVLRGADALLARNAIHFVFAEVGFQKSDTDMQYFCEFHEYVQVHGLDFCGLYNSFRYGPAKQFVSFSNALYVNSSFGKA